MTQKNILRFLTVMVCMSFCLLPVKAAKEVADTLTVRDVFIRLPLKVLDIIDHRTRLDMMDYYDAGREYKAPNGMEGLSELKKMTSDYMEVEITPVTTMQIALYHPKNRKDAAVGVFYTINGDRQAADTDVTFFDESLRELKRDKYFEYPDITDFFNIPDKDTEKMIEDLIPFPTIEFLLNPDNMNVTATLTVGEYIGEEDYAKVKPYLKGPLTFVWNGKKYEMRK